jgi:hypothetical protein
MLAVQEETLMRLQERIDTFEAQARGRLARAFSTGNEKLVELDRALARVERDDWSVKGMQRQVERLRARADNLRADVVRRAPRRGGHEARGELSHPRPDAREGARGHREALRGAGEAAGRRGGARRREGGGPVDRQGLLSARRPRTLRPPAGAAGGFDHGGKLAGATSS